MLTAALAGALLFGCSGDDEDGAGALLLERWTRAGLDYTSNVAVYEGELPPMFSDLLNPEADAETPEQDRVAFPVHPDGELLGSYIVDQPDGATVAVLMYDVPETTVSDVIATVKPQLDGSPWQVTEEQASRSYQVLAFQSTRSDEVTGNTVVQGVPATDDWTLVVERDGAEQTLDIRRASAAPRIEAALADNLAVTAVHPGLARLAGLQEGDRILRVGDTGVGSAQELQRALEGLASGPQTVSVTYIVEFAAPLEGATPTYVPYEELALPDTFPAAEAFAGLAVDEYRQIKNPAGDQHYAFMNSDETPTDVAARIREGLEGAGWEIVSDQPSGFATVLEFAHEEDRLIGALRVDVSTLDESRTDVFVQIQENPATN